MMQGVQSIVVHSNIIQGIQAYSKKREEKHACSIAYDVHGVSYFTLFLITIKQVSMTISKLFIHCIVNLLQFNIEIYWRLIDYLKGCGTVLKETPPATGTGNLAHCCRAKLESTAQCCTIPVPPITGTLKMSKSQLIKVKEQYLGKMNETVGEEGP